MPVEGRIDSAFPTSDATPPCGNCQRSKAPCLYQVVRHLDAGFLTMQAWSRMAGSLRAPHQDRGAWNGGTVQTLGSDPGWPLRTGRVLPFPRSRRHRVGADPRDGGDVATTGRG